MELQSSWDLFIIVFFAIIVAYSYVIGHYRTLKVILSSYIAILAADGVGNLIERYLPVAKPYMDSLPVKVEIAGDALIVFKILVFVVFIILLATRGRFGLVVSKEPNRFLQFFLTMAYGILSAGLIISTILVYTSGSSFIEAMQGEKTVNSIQVIAEHSRMLSVMVDNYDIWFAMPALVFVVASIFVDGDENLG